MLITICKIWSISPNGSSFKHIFFIIVAASYLDIRLQIVRNGITLNFKANKEIKQNTAEVVSKLYKQLSNFKYNQEKITCSWFPV